MKYALAYFLLFCLLYAVYSHQCPEGWTYFEGSQACYQKFYKKKLDYYESRYFCRSEHNADLVSIHSMAEEDFILNFINSTHFYFYLGLESVAAPCEGAWSDGTSADLIQYMFYNRQTTVRKDCRLNRYALAVKNIHQKRYITRTDGYKQRYYTVCKKSIASELTCAVGWKFKEGKCIKETPSNKSLGHITHVDSVHKHCPEGWTLFKGSQACYRMFNHKADYYDSRYFCRSEQNADLVSIHSMAEEDFILNFATMSTYSFYLGLEEIHGPCEGSWSDGSSADLTKYIFEKRKYCNRDRYATVSRVRNKKTTITRTWDGAELPYTVCKISLSSKVTCEAGWEFKDGKCIKIAVTEPTVTTTRPSEKGKPRPRLGPDTISRQKCVGLPFRTYYQSQKKICYVATQNCSSVKYHLPLYDVNYLSDQAHLKKLGMDLEKTGLCSFGRDYKCENGKLVGAQCIRLSKKAGSMNEVLSDCESTNQKLFAPRDDRDMQLILEFLETLSEPVNTGVWLGIVLNDNWITLDGKDLDFLRWKSPVTPNTNLNAALFLNDKVSATQGSHAAYMTPKNKKESFFGVCRGEPL